MKREKEPWTFWLGRDYESRGDGHERRALTAGQGSDGISRAERTGMPHLLFVLHPAAGFFVPDALISDDAHKPYPDWVYRFNKISLREARKVALEIPDRGPVEQTHQVNQRYQWFGAAQEAEVSVADLLGAEVAEALAGKDWSADQFPWLSRPSG